ncbi:MAG: hypothetical protein ISS41_03600 [Candidatus Aminicenantes bacterium]|nr:hypothetical protein [Candidatus Aminicenantes bacterium]
MKKIAFLTLIVLIFWGCVTFSQSYKLGHEAAISKNWDEAIKYFESAAREDPKNSVYRLALLRAKLAASYDHLNKARELASHEKKEEALAEYKKALSYGYLGRDIVEEVQSLTKEEEPEEEEPKEIRIEPPVKLKVGDEKIILKFPVEAPLRSIFQALGKHARVNILLDEQFRDIPFSIDLVDMNFERALNSLCMASKNFYRVIDERTIIIAPDLPQKRVQYELNAVKTFYLSNINAEEIRADLTTILRSQYKGPTIIVDKNLNSVTIRDAPEIIELAERILRIWDKPKGEIIVDLEIMEVSRVKLRQLGLELEAGLIGLRYSDLEPTTEPSWMKLKDLDFSKTENFHISLPAAVVQFLESDSDTKIISQPRLRGLDGEEMTYVVGDKIPIPRTTFTPIAIGGISQQPVTNFEYEDVGIDVKITPRIHFEREVTLELEIKVKSLGGAGFANIPIITTREVKNVIRLKDGETNLLAGLLKDEERKTVSGIVGLKHIPILGGLLSSTNQTIQQTDVILTITPRIIRIIPVSEEDQKPLWIGTQGISSTVTTGQQPPERELLDQRARQAAEQEQTGARSGENQIRLNPPSLNVSRNREFRISVNARIQGEVSNMSLNINFNPEVVRLKEVIQGRFLSQLGEDVPFLKNIDNSSGFCILGFSNPVTGKGIKGTGSFATLVFESIGSGESPVSVTEISANNPSGQTVTFTSSESRIIVK